MSNDHRQRRRRLSVRFWIIVFKAVIAIGQLANLATTWLSLRK